MCQKPQVLSHDAKTSKIRKLTTPSLRIPGIVETQDKTHDWRFVRQKQPSGGEKRRGKNTKVVYGMLYLLVNHQ